MTTRSPITTHVLDISRGKAASGVPVSLERQNADGTWTLLKRARTNADGRVEDLLPPGSKAELGLYQLVFDTRSYLEGAGLKWFYPYATVAFEITSSTEHYHVPLLLSPFGYSTYRGT